MYLLALLLAFPVMAGELPAYHPDPNAARADVPDLYKWDLSPLFADDGAWDAELVRVTPEVARIETFKGRLADPRALRECLDHYFSTSDAVNRLTLYASLRQAIDETDATALAMDARAQALMADLTGRGGFIRAEVLALSDKQLNRAFKKEKGLSAYRAWLDDILRRRARVLDPEAERVMTLAGDNLWLGIDLNEVQSDSEKAYRGLLSDLPWPTVQDAAGKDVTLNLQAYSALRASPDRETRRKAVGAFMGTLRQYQDAFAATLGGQARLDVTYARARHYDTAVEAYLDKEHVDPRVYDTLVTTVNAHLEPLHRYVSLRRRMLGVEHVHFYDMYVPLVESVDMELPFPQARTTILAALAPLGPEYVSVIELGTDLSNGWLDLYPSEGKSSGGFCAATYGRHPYILMNYQDSYDDMSTVAHEMGHAAHSWFSMKEQPTSQWSYAGFLAEIASTANEALLLDHLLATTTDPDQRIFLLNERVDGIKGTIYRQAMLSEFDLAVHRFVEAGTPVTAELLDQTWRELAQRYYGPNYALDADDGMEWAYIRHFYYKYYLYTYATGLSSGLALAERVRSGPEARDAYLGMLKGGASASPLDLLRGAGVDLTGPQPIETAMKVFDESLTELEKLLDERATRQAAPPQ